LHHQSVDLVTRFSPVYLRAPRASITLELLQQVIEMRESKVAGALCRLADLLEVIQLQNGPRASGDHARAQIGERLVQLRICQRLRGFALELMRSDLHDLASNRSSLSQVGAGAQGHRRKVTF